MPTYVSHLKSRRKTAAATARQTEKNFRRNMKLLEHALRRHNATIARVR
jgi:hypothetical protein